MFAYWIGRANDLIGVLSGRDLYADSQHIYLAGHGDENRICLPSLHESIYEPGEPRDYFGPAEVIQHARLHGQTVLASGCTTGQPQLAHAFLQAGCQTYIGPIGDIAGPRNTP